MLFLLVAFSRSAKLMPKPLFMCIFWPFLFLQSNVCPQRQRLRGVRSIVLMSELHGGKLFFFFLEEGMGDSFPKGKGLAGGDQMILVIENFNLTE